MVQKGKEQSQYWQEKIQRELFDALPKPYLECHEAIKLIQHAFAASAAALLQPALNEHLKTVPHTTLEEKRELATWLNEQLRSLGLTIQCPKTKRPGILKADFKDSQHADSSRFRVEVKDEGRGHGKYHSFTSSHLWEITLMEAPRREEPFAKEYTRRRRGNDQNER